jgi:peptidylprolyl isomerase
MEESCSSLSRFFLGMLNLIFSRLKTLFTSLTLILVAVVLSISLSAASAVPTNWVAALPAGNAVTDPKALLRLALPIDNPQVRKLQSSLEEIANLIRGKRWSAINGNIAKASGIIRDHSADLLATVPAERQTQATTLISQIDTELTSLRDIVETKERDPILDQKNRVLDFVGDLEALMVQQFPYQVPEEYRYLPQLLGRATVTIQTSKGDITLVADGYSAPVTAGNFVDLVKRKFYDGLPFTRAEESYVLQVGDPEGPEVGFIDPKTKKYRAIPFEMLVAGDTKPEYGVTLEDAGRYLDQPVLPFSAFGTVALARGEDPNGGSSQFFFFLFEPELTPAGRNLLDGRYSVFAYVTDGFEVLRQLRPGDKIITARVTEGAQNLVAGA